MEMAGENPKQLVQKVKKIKNDTQKRGEGSGSSGQGREKYEGRSMNAELRTRNAAHCPPATLQKSFHH
jgi:hypothetical protein